MPNQYRYIYLLLSGDLCFYRKYLMNMPFKKNIFRTIFLNHMSATSIGCGTFAHIASFEK